MSFTTNELRVVNELGLHARAASKLAEVAGRAKKSIWLKNGHDRVDAASVIDILSLACARGSTITFLAEDESDIHILEELTRLVESGFGE